jgi:hypothetical protein
MKRFAGKAVLVTGPRSAGLGLAICEFVLRFAAEGRSSGNSYALLTALPAVAKLSW